MAFYDKIIKFAEQRKLLMQNFSFITILQLFSLIAPLITYPYLVEVLGLKLYGIVLSAQMLSSYATLIVDFGSNLVCAKHVSRNRNNLNKLSEIVNSVLCVRIGLFFLCFTIYLLIIYIVPEYRSYALLFILSYGMVSIDVLMPQYLFQGLERMRDITLITIFSRLVFIILVFICVKDASDYLYVPLLYTIGYLLSGAISMYITFKKIGINFYIPKVNTMLYYVKDSFPLFTTDLVCTIKDKVNYMMVGLYIGMDNVVVYDLALKINNLISKPISIINTVMFPRVSKSQNLNQTKRIIIISFCLVCLIVLIVNLFLPFIVDFFLHEKVDITPIRLFTLAPLFLSVSVCLAQNFFVAFNFNKYVFYSIIVTTIVYIISISFFLLLGKLDSIYIFISISLISYLAELVYRLFASYKLSRRLRY